MLFATRPRFGVAPLRLQLSLRYLRTRIVEKKHQVLVTCVKFTAWMYWGQEPTPKVVPTILMIHDSSIHSQQKNRKTLKFQCSFLGFTFWGPLSRALCSNSLSEGLIIGFSSSKLSMSSTSSKCKAIWRFQGGQCMVSPQQTMTKHCCFMLFPYPIGPMYTISTYYLPYRSTKCR